MVRDYSNRVHDLQSAGNKMDYCYLKFRGSPSRIETGNINVMRPFFHGFLSTLNGLQSFAI